jgi:hypothetical protein
MIGRLSNYVEPQAFLLLLLVIVMGSLLLLSLAFGQVLIQHVAQALSTRQAQSFVIMVRSGTAMDRDVIGLKM